MPQLKLQAVKGSGSVIFEIDPFRRELGGLSLSLAIPVFTVGLGLIRVICKAIIEDILKAV